MPVTRLASMNPGCSSQRYNFKRVGKIFVFQCCVFASPKTRFVSHSPWPTSPPGDSSRSSMSKWTACWGPNIRSELHRSASCHTPGSCASAAGQQAGDPYVSTEGPFAAWDAGEAINTDKYTYANVVITGECSSYLS